MGVRGRQSQTALITPIGQYDRVRAPVTLTDSQTDLWRQIVNRMPADWFTAENVPLLEAYCKAVDIHRTITNQLDIFQTEWLTTDEGLKRYSKLTEIQGRQANVMKTLATGMRLTQQSRYRADKAAPLLDKAKAQDRPWEFKAKSERDV